MDLPELEKRILSVVERLESPGSPEDTSRLSQAVKGYDLLLKIRLAAQKVKDPANDRGGLHPSVERALRGARKEHGPGDDP